MVIRLGYACINNTLNFTNKTISYTNFSKSYDYSIIDNIIKNNLSNLKEILIYNIKNNIYFYRLNSDLIPLNTKQDVLFDYINPYKKQYEEISKLIKNNNLRIDFHPSEFCILNSTNKDVLKRSIDILEYHYNILNALNIEKKIIIIHIGGSTFGKKNSIKRFINNYNKLPNHLKNCIAIENDDKIFNINDCIEINKKTNIPIILDVHHHNCNNVDILDNYIIDIFNTWNSTPKIHFSSPKSKLKKEYRSHNDNINSDDFINFIENIKKYNTNIDIMLEAKKKDEALFKLVRELKYKTNYKFINDTSFIVK